MRLFLSSPFPKTQGCDYSELREAVLAAGFGHRSDLIFETFLQVQAVDHI